MSLFIFASFKVNCHQFLQTSTWFLNCQHIKTKILSLDYCLHHVRFTRITKFYLKNRRPLMKYNSFIVMKSANPIHCITVAWGQGRSKTIHHNMSVFRIQSNICDGTFLRKQLTAFSRKLFSQKKGPSQIFGWVLIAPLHYITLYQLVNSCCTNETKPFVIFNP